MVEGDGAELTARVASTAPRAASVDAADVLGLKYTLTEISGGNRAELGGGYSTDLAQIGAVRFRKPTSPCKIEARVVLFRTRVPVESHWMPERTGYSELSQWTMAADCPK